MLSHLGFMWLKCLFMISLCNGMEYVDLSYDIHEDSAYWPSSISYSREATSLGYTPKGFWMESYHFCMMEHTGTHLDAPSHFAEGKWTVDEIPILHLFGPGVVIDIQDKVAKDPNAELSTADVMAWLNEHGPFPDGAIIFIRTGWSSRYGNKTEYYGTDNNDVSNLIFPGISVGAAQLIVTHEDASGKSVVGVGLDTPSIDHGPSKDFKAHRTLCEANIYGLENVADLSKLPPKGFDVLVMPTKLRGGSGGPARIVALVPDDSASPPSAAILGTPLIVASVLLSQLLHHLF